MSSEDPGLAFGDQLALARLAWVGLMTQQLTARGFADYRRSDALVMRTLRSGPVSVGELAGVLHVSRQAARKIAETLKTRELATIQRDRVDARRRTIALTELGERYAAAVVSTIEQLNRRVADVVPTEDLAVTLHVLKVISAGRFVATPTPGASIA